MSDLSGRVRTLPIEPAHVFLRLTDGDQRVREAEERELLREVAAGRQEALEALFHRYHGPLFRYVGGLVGNSATAEEVVLDSFFVVWRVAGRFRGASSVGTWLFGIGRHKALSARRTQGRPAEGDEMLPPMPSNGVDVLEQLSSAAAATRVRRALAALSPEHGEVIELSIYPNFSYRQIAEILGCPVNTVKTRAYYARQHLKRLPADLEAEAGHAG